MNRIFLFSLFLIITISGCDVPVDNAVIDTQIPPAIIESSIAPVIVDFGKINTSGSTIDISIHGYVYANDDNGLSDIASVSFRVFSPSGKLFTSGILNDNGVLPDVNASDGKYNSQIDLKLPKEVIGIYNIQFFATDRNGFTSNTFNIPLNIILSTNNAPRIFNLSSPDSVRVPNSADTVNLIYISLGVSDQQGLSDIVSVVLTSQRPDSSVAGTFTMADDGGKTVLPQFGLTSGDSLAGDGIFSIIVPIFSTTPRNTYRDFIFAARDQSNAYSNVIIKRIFIQ
jgi:hypothetical protein